MSFEIQNINIKVSMFLINLEISNSALAKSLTICKKIYSMLKSECHVKCNVMHQIKQLFFSSYALNYNHI